MPLLEKKKTLTKQTPFNFDYNQTVLTVKPVHPYHRASAVTPLLITVCFVLTGWEGNIERQQGTWRQKKKMECSTLHLIRLACVRVRKIGASRSPWERLLCRVVSILSFTSPKKGTAADTGSYRVLWNFLSSSNFCFFFSPGKPSIHKRWRERGHYFVGIVSCHILYQCFFAPIPAGPPGFRVPALPPGEEGSSALETLCVGLVAGSLGGSGCFNNYRGHLDELQGRFGIFQGLAQV